MADVERIREMEAILDRSRAELDALSQRLDALDALREPMGRLFRYYGSEAWYRDRESPLPPEVKAGVLSEDAVYDAVVDARDAAIRMLELATDLLKNRI